MFLQYSHTAHCWGRCITAREALEGGDGGRRQADRRAFVLMCGVLAGLDPLVALGGPVVALLVARWDARGGAAVGPEALRQRQGGAGGAGTASGCGWPALPARALSGSCPLVGPACQGTLKHSKRRVASSLNHGLI